MRAEVLISYEHAKALWRLTDVELLWVDDEGHSSVVEEGDIDPKLQYAIDGVVVGEPYDP